MKCGPVGTDLLRLYQLELHATTSPGYEVAVSWVVQQRDQELPELQGAAALVWWPVAVARRLLFDFSCERRDRRGVRLKWMNKAKEMLQECYQDGLLLVVYQHHTLTTGVETFINVSDRITRLSWLDYGFISYLLTFLVPHKYHQRTVVGLSQRKTLEKEKHPSFNQCPCRKELH